MTLNIDDILTVSKYIERLSNTCKKLEKLDPGDEAYDAEVKRMIEWMSERGAIADAAERRVREALPDALAAIVDEPMRLVLLAIVQLIGAGAVTAALQAEAERRDAHWSPRAMAERMLAAMRKKEVTP